MKSAIPALTITAALLVSGGNAFALQSGQPQSSTKASKPRPSGPGGTSARLSPVQRQLQQNPGLGDRLTDRLPRTLDPVSAASGFRTLHAFVAAVSASNNLQIPFVTMKARLLKNQMNLGQAIRRLRPSANYRAEVQRAEREAAAIIGK